MKSLRGNPVEQRGARLYEHLREGWRFYNPTRDRRRHLMAKLGITSARQWKKIRRALRANGETV